MQPHAESFFFLFPIVFGINLIYIFDGKNSEARNSIHCFGSSIICRAISERQNEECDLFRKVQRLLATENVSLAPFERGGDKCEFLARKSANSSSIPVLPR